MIGFTYGGVTARAIGSCLRAGSRCHQCESSKDVSKHERVLGLFAFIVDHYSSRHSYSRREYTAIKGIETEIGLTR